MPSLDQMKYETLFAMFKGEPGTRKSTQALSFPTPQYWFSHDKKMQALTLPMRAWSISGKDIDYDDYNDYAAMGKKLEQLQINCKYKTIVVDSITSVGDSINRQTIRLKSGTTTKSGDEKGLRVGGIPVNSIEDYKAEASGFLEMISLLKDISNFHHCNIILIAHVIGDRSSKDSNGSTHFARIIVTGGKIISAKIPAYCTEVYHFNVKQSMDTSQEGKYGLITVHTGDDFARTALPLDKEIIFNNNKLYDAYLLPAITKLNNKG